MEQKLLDLTSASKKALLRGENLCSKADTLVRNCRLDVENIERIYPKLRFFWGELDVQIKNVETLRQFALKQNKFIRQFHATKEKELGTIMDELENTLETLRRKPVDPAICKSALTSNMTTDNGENQTAEVSLKGLIEPENLEKEKFEKTTLFDYVDEQSIHELKIRTQEEVNAIQQFHNDSTNLLKNIDIQLEHFNTMFNNNSISLEESGIEFSDLKCQIQERATSTMAETLMSLARHYDQVSGALKASQSHVEANSILDISVLIKDTGEIPNIVEELNEALTIIESTSEEVRVRNHIYNASLEEATKLFHELENFSSRMEDIVGEIKAIEADFEKGKSMVERLIEELWNLIGWYEEFLKSYDYMILEIDRRHEVREIHEKLAEEYLAKLENLYIEEAQNRDLFFQKHGRYLPMDLCPPLTEPPIRFEIIQHEGIRLPVLSSAAVEEDAEGRISPTDNVPIEKIMCENMGILHGTRQFVKIQSRSIITETTFFGFRLFHVTILRAPY
ncbi:4140_t:CDS:10 [Ambispora gerdemannii]|uniref:Autophagy-related protein 17 n=1 Tax=Ambispora gerdemannii TaxID=144530 RepID=A0A9N8ZHG2_9GLOM|nr:4140_t:CDS:10 [Ambispora gerdemannii]